MKVSVRHDLAHPREDARSALFEGNTWERFLREGEALKSTVDLRPDEGRVRVAWTSPIAEDAPAIARRLVGNSVDLDLRIQVQHGEDWRLDLDGVDGQATLRSHLRMEPDGAGCRVLLDGDFCLRGGPFNVAARFEGPAWEHVVRAILVQDLLPLL